MRLHRRLWFKAIMMAGATLMALVGLPPSAVLAAGGVWSPAPSMNTARGMHAASLLLNGTVLVAGGGNSGGVQASAELYDPTTNTWSPAASMNKPRLYHAAVRLANGKVLVIGGGYDAATQQSAEVYDPDANSWTLVANLNVARGLGHTATVLANGKVLVTGGYNGSSGYQTSAEIYDPVYNTWSPVSGMTVARASQTATLLPDGTVLVAGGANSVPLASAEVYDPTANTWFGVGSMSVTRLGSTATLLNNNRVLIVGGYTGHSQSGALTSCQFFDAFIPPPTPPPAVTLTYPNGGEILRATADIRVRISQPQGKRVLLSVFLNDVQIAFNGGTTVQPNADGSPVDVVRTFDTTTKADGKDAYRLKVVAALEENPAVSSQVVSAAPFTIDNGAPFIALPANEQAPVLEQTSYDGAQFTFHPAVSDSLDPAPVLTISGALANYPRGTTIVTFTARDWAGNQSSLSVNVVVRDTRPPSITAPPDVVAEAGLPVNLGVPTVSDIGDPQPTVTNNAPASFPVGVTTVTWTATDAAGNEGKATQRITITVINARVNIDPNTINLKSQSDKNAVTAYIELPSGYDVARMNVATVELFINGTRIAGAQLTPTSVGDYDKDGVPDRMVKFDRQSVIAALTGKTGDVTLIVTGNLTDGRWFTGTDTIKVINQGK